VPQARNNLARTLVRGEQMGRTESASADGILDLDSAILKKDFEFLVEGAFRVMFPLSCDIRPDYLDLRRAHGENAITLLPLETCSEPPRCVGFDLLHQFGYAEACRYRNEEMEVVSRAVRSNQFEPEIPSDATDEWADLVGLLFGDTGLSFVGCEDDVEKNCRIGMTHVDAVPKVVPGLTSGAKLFRPSGTECRRCSVLHLPRTAVRG
jgi:hypothetical protein